MKNNNNQLVASHNALNELKQKITEGQNEIDRLTKEIESDRLTRARELPQYFGVTDMDQALSILRNANVIKEVKTYHNTAKNYDSKQGKKIPERIRNQVKAEVERGNLTGTEIAKKLRISLPSVQNIKKELGMVRAYASSN
jgi:hypothetical protein